MPTLYDRVLETSNSTGTGDFTLEGAITGYTSFASTVGNSTTYYCIENKPAGEWEVGVGEISGGDTLTRTVVLASSDDGDKVNFTSGVKNVFLPTPASVILYSDGSYSDPPWIASLAGSKITSPLNSDINRNTTLELQCNTNGYINFGDGSRALMQMNMSDSTAIPSVRVIAGYPDKIPLVVEAAASQTANMLEFHTSGGLMFFSYETDVISGNAGTIRMRCPGRTDRDFTIMTDQNRTRISNPIVGLELSGGFGTSIISPGYSTDEGIAFVPSSATDGSSPIRIALGRNCGDFKFQHGAKIQDDPCRKVIFYGDNAYSSATTNVDGGSVYLCGGDKVSGGDDGNVILGHDGTSAKGIVGVGTDAPTATLTVKAVADQPNNLQEWQTSAGYASIAARTTGVICFDHGGGGQSKIVFAYMGGDRSYIGYVDSTHGPGISLVAQDVKIVPLSGSTAYLEGGITSGTPQTFVVTPIKAGNYGGFDVDGSTLKLLGGDASNNLGAPADFDGGNAYVCGGSKTENGTDGNVVLCHDGTNGKGKLCVGNGVSDATTPGSVQKKLPIYDEDGTLLGYIALYDAIT